MARKESDLIVLENLITKLNELISSTKALYYDNLGKKLNNPLLQVKMYWSILSFFVMIKNSTNSTSCDRKIFVTDNRTKANIFNKFFAEQCTSLRNGSLLPSRSSIFKEKESINLSCHKS